MGTLCDGGKCGCGRIGRGRAPDQSRLACRAASSSRRARRNAASGSANGRLLPLVVRSEDDAVRYVRDHVDALATTYAHPGVGWSALCAGWDTKRINHSVIFRDGDVCTSQAESHFSRLHRAEMGKHRHIAGS